jgi:ectoine hydroxylase-related dioxygenase (phytanoyl-CoA dioxygenase family)
MPELAYLPSDAALEDIAQVIHRDGACVVTNAISSDVLDEVIREIQPFVDDTPPGCNDFAGTSTTRTGGLVGRSPSTRSLIMHPLVLGVGKLILAETQAMQLTNTEIISIGPRETVQPLHRDQDVWPFPFPPGYVPQFSTMWPLNRDFTLENGATRLVLGTHRSGIRTSFDDSEIAQAPMTRGSVLIWSGATYHGGAANNSGEIRQGANFTYAVGWLRQEENQYLVVPREIAKDLDDDLLRLIGYDRPTPELGNGIDHSHPLGFFRPHLAQRGHTDPLLGIGLTHIAPEDG